MAKKPPFKHGVTLCIFCGAVGKRTGEHIWPVWYRDYVKRGDNPAPRNRQVTSLSYVHEGKVLFRKTHRNRLSRPGELADQRLKIVCGQCNGGWMSVLQSQAKLILHDYLIGDFTKKLTEADQKTLAEWACMFTMVLEFSDPKSVGITKEERTKFYEIREFPSLWTVLIGRNADIPTDYFHRALALYPSSIPKSIGKAHNTQITTFTFGPLIFQTFSTSSELKNFEGFRQDMARYGASLRLERIWPIKVSEATLPRFSIGVANFRYVATALSNDFFAMDPSWKGAVPPPVW